MVSQAPATRDMNIEEFLGNINLLMVGGNDTTRNSMTASVLAMHRFPDQLAKLKADPSLIERLMSSDRTPTLDQLFASEQRGEPIDALVLRKDGTEAWVSLTRPSSTRRPSTRPSVSI